MKVVIQRVKESEVKVKGRLVGRIGRGMVVLLAVGKDDTADDIEYLTKKLAELRIFEDENGKMNCSISEAKGAFLVVSQFTLLGDCEKGRRPSFDKAADPQKAEQLYNQFVDKLKIQGFEVATGEFRAMMDVFLVNDGPVTLILESKVAGV